MRRSQHHIFPGCGWNFGNYFFCGRVYDVNHFPVAIGDKFVINKKLIFPYARLPVVKNLPEMTQKTTTATRLRSWPARSSVSPGIRQDALHLIISLIIFSRQCPPQRVKSGGELFGRYASTRTFCLFSAPKRFKNGVIRSSVLPCFSSSKERSCAFCRLSQNCGVVPK